MADDRTTPEAADSELSSDQPRPKKRAAPTIDLTATEVPAAGNATPPKPDTAASEESPEAAATSPEPHSKQGRLAFVAAAVTGAAAGIAATLLVLAVLWAAGLWPLHPSPAPAVKVAADGKALDTLTQRVNTLEADLKKISAGDSGLADRLTAAENAMKSLGVALAALSHHNDDVATAVTQAREQVDAAVKAVADLKASMASTPGVSRSDIDALDKRIAALEGTAQSTKADISKISSKSSDNSNATRLALSAAALRDAVTSGAPFTNELGAVRQLGGDDKSLAPLTPFAATGVPSAAALANELRALLPAMEKPANASAPQGGFFERLQANAARLVRIRPINAPAGNDPAAVLSRLEADSAKADIAAALADLDRLDAATRAPAQDWIGKARARQAALDAARNYAAETARVLGAKAE